MSAWGTSLYANDWTCDVRDTYIGFLEAKFSNAVAYEKTIESFCDYLDTELEPLLWYALADTQWALGRLMPDVKDKAMFWIENKGGLGIWDENLARVNGWKKTMASLKARLDKQPPKEKKIESPAEYQYNPGDIGDVFAYKFHSTEAQRLGFHGKYILLQKLGSRESFNGYICPHFIFFDMLFNEIPTTISLQDIRILPFDVPERFMPSGRNQDFPFLNMSAVLELSQKRGNPSKYMKCIGNFPLVQCDLTHIDYRSEFAWDCIEETLLYYYSEWRKYSYKLYDTASVVLMRKTADSKTGKTGDSLHEP